MEYPTSRSYRPTLQEVKQASKRLKDIAIKTPLIPLRWYDENPNILLKPEVLQPIGSYKLRGVYNWVAKLSPKDRKHGIATFSTGNMAQAVGYVAKLFKVPARIVVLETASKYKIELMKRYGVKVDVIKLDLIWDYLENLPFDHCFIHPLYEYGLLDGYGTISLEIHEQAPDVDTIFVPVGAGLLSVGITLAMKELNPYVRVIGVQTENSPHYYNSFKKGELAPFKYVPSICDGIAIGQTDPWKEPTELVMGTLDDMVVVSEDKVRDAIRYLALENNLVTEGAGAIAVAAALEMPIRDRGKSVCILSGGSIDGEKLSKILVR